jgi:hypothetical protein
LLVYKIPLTVALYDRVVLVGGGALLTAVLVSVMWFVAAAGSMLWRATPIAYPRRWDPSLLAAVFVGFSLAGGAASVVTSLCAIPLAVAELLHWAAFAPAMGVVLGAYLLLHPEQSGPSLGRRALIWALVVLDLVWTIALPIALSKVTPAAVAAVAILYGLNEAGVETRRQLIAATLFCCLTVVALPFKEYLRMALYNGDAFVPRACSLKLSGNGAMTSGNGAMASGASSRGLFSRFAKASHDYSHVVAVFPPKAAGLWWPTLHGGWGLVEYGAARALVRLNRLGDLAYVVKETPSRVAFAYGATYAPIVATVVPRAIWPGKPLNDGAGQFFGHRYDFLDPSDNIHDVNLPIITEGWINGGWVGVLISAVAVGALLRVVWRRWIGDSGAPGNIVIGMAVVSAAVDQESSLGLMVGGVIHALVLFGVLEYVLRKSRRGAFRRNAPSGASAEVVA